MRLLLRPGPCISSPLLLLHSSWVGKWTKYNALYACFHTTLFTPASRLRLCLLSNGGHFVRVRATLTPPNFSKKNHYFHTNNAEPRVEYYQNSINNNPRKYFIRINSDLCGKLLKFLKKCKKPDANATNARASQACITHAKSQTSKNKMHLQS